MPLPTSRQTRRLKRQLLALAERARALAFDMDFRFLMDPERRLLSIGYRTDNKELDRSCYDLLASEARLTSLFAIAKGDLPKEHWFRLGRPVTSVRWQAGAGILVGLDVRISHAAARHV